jgi:hypothetical protein
MPKTEIKFVLQIGKDACVEGHVKVAFEGYAERRFDWVAQIRWLNRINRISNGKFPMMMVMITVNDEIGRESRKRKNRLISSY